MANCNEYLTFRPAVPGIEVDKIKIDKAVAVMIQVYKGQRRNKFMGDCAGIFVNINMMKMPEKSEHIRIPIYLPHRISHADTSVCLITKDIIPEGLERIPREYDHTIQYFQDLLDKHGVHEINEIKPLVSIKLELREHELRRKFANMHDIFLADARVYRLLPNLLGRSFTHEALRYIVNVDLTSENLKDSIDKGLRTTCGHYKPANTYCEALVGHSKLTPEQISDNIQTAVRIITGKLPGGPRNVRKIEIHFYMKMPIPIYFSGEPASGVDMNDTIMVRRSPFVTKPQQITTLKNALVKFTGPMDFKIIPCKMDSAGESSSDEDEMEEVKWKEMKLKDFQAMVKEEKEIDWVEYGKEVRKMGPKAYSKDRKRMNETDELDMHGRRIGQKSVKIESLSEGSDIVERVSPKKKQKFVSNQSRIGGNDTNTSVSPKRKADSLESNRSRSQLQSTPDTSVSKTKKKSLDGPEENKSSSEVEGSDTGKSQRKKKMSLSADQSCSESDSGTGMSKNKKKKSLEASQGGSQVEGSDMGVSPKRKKISLESKQEDSGVTEAVESTTLSPKKKKQSLGVQPIARQEVGSDESLNVSHVGTSAADFVAADSSTDKERTCIDSHKLESDGDKDTAISSSSGKIGAIVGKSHVSSTLAAASQNSIKSSPARDIAESKPDVKKEPIMPKSKTPEYGRNRPRRSRRLSITDESVASPIRKVGSKRLSMAVKSSPLVMRTAIPEEPSMQEETGSEGKTSVEENRSKEATHEWPTTSGGTTSDGATSEGATSDGTTTEEATSTGGTSKGGSTKRRKSTGPSPVSNRTRKRMSIAKM